MTFNFVSCWNTKRILPNQIYRNGSIPIIWKVILLGDGSFTRHSEILTYAITSVDHLNTFIYSNEQILLKSFINRKVWIGTNTCKKLIFASSWWNIKGYEKLYKYPSQAIGSFFIQSELDFYRDIHEIFLGYSFELEKLFSSKGPFWGRHYTLFYKGKPISIIYEIFSPLLENFQ
uniref:Uncharacterized protein ycf21 n=1 Tax=Porphyra purpurea TaxID=2787 RepID=YCF21_PORPU|nr:Ycf21 [Porphyra purpurea]P51380.1 RecName: Full=Uncharacterized protein ycf21 [Porphyra purpurea]AAC08266.1 hypothetical chloroplast ORF 21 [Porphyra purpurea]